MTASSVEKFSAAMVDLLRRELPTKDRFFNLEAALCNHKKVVFLEDGNECGALLYEVFDNPNGEKLFFIAALSLDAKKAITSGSSVYEWIELEAKKLGCRFVIFDSPRRGMLFYARKFGWEIVNIRYQKKI